MASCSNNQMLYYKYRVLPGGSQVKHRKNCESCLSQVTLKVKYKCQFCHVLSCPALSVKNGRREKIYLNHTQRHNVMEPLLKCYMSGDDTDLPSRKVVGSCVEPLNIPWNILCLMTILTRKVVGSYVEPFNRSNQGGRGKWHSELHTQILIRDFRFRFDRLVCVEWIFIHYRGWIILIKICFLWNCFVLS